MITFTRSSTNSTERGLTSTTTTASAKDGDRISWALTLESPAGFACRLPTRTRRRLLSRRLSEDQRVKSRTLASTSAPIREIDILWITAGLGCDGDTIAITAATQPSLEDILLGALPGIPQVNFHNPFLSYENGESFLHPFHLAAEGKLAPFILVVEGSIPNETIKEEGYWAALGTDKTTGQPITTCEWIDRLAPKAWAVVAAGTCATYGGIHAMEGNP